MNRTDKLLKDLCDRADGPLHQEEIAEYIGVTQQRVSDIERGAMQKLIDGLNMAGLCGDCNSDILEHLNSTHGKL